MKYIICGIIIYVFLGFLITITGPEGNSSSFWKVLFLYGIRPFVSFERWVKISNKNK